MPIKFYGSKCYEQEFKNLNKNVTFKEHTTLEILQHTLLGSPIIRTYQHEYPPERSGVRDTQDFRFLGKDITPYVRAQVGFFPKKEKEDGELCLTEFSIYSGYMYFYRNLRKKMWQIRTPAESILLDLLNAFIVLKYVHPHVQKGGKKRAMETGQRNVHSFLRCTKAYIFENHDELKLPNPSAKPITYRPFEEPGWIYKADGSEFKYATQAMLTSNFQCLQVGS